MNAAAALPYRAREFAGLIAFYRHELERLGVTLRLGQAASSSDFADFDEVLIATGAQSSLVPDGAIDAFEMLSARRLPEAARLDVFGGGEIAVTAASWLRDQGKRVMLHAPPGPIGGAWNGSQVEMALNHLKQAGIAVAENAAAPADAHGWIWEPILKPSDDLASLGDGEHIAAIGAAARGGRLYEATQSGYWTAARI